MASKQPPPPPKKKKKSTTTISALGDDLLRLIFLRLPCLPSLVRAAFTCKAFLDAVRSSPAFRNDFRKLHPPPILGVFHDIYDNSLPAFSPIRLRSDLDLAAAVRGADVFLTRLPADADADADAPEWSMTDCRNGYVFLANPDQMAAYNPVTAALYLFPHPPDELCEVAYVYMLSDEEDHGSFGAVCILHNKRGAQAAVLSSDTREWQILSEWADESKQPGDDQYWLQDHTLADGFVCWTFEGETNVCVLNTKTMQFCRIDLPPHTEGREFKAGETKDGKFCMVILTELTIVVWVWRAGDDGVGTWVLHNAFPLHDATDEYLDGHAELRILAITRGLLYLSAFNETHPTSPCWLLSFCLETGELKKLFPIIRCAVSYPYIMAWPRSLVRNEEGA